MKNEIELLWVSPMAPYNAVKHAGGKTHNYYTKSFSSDRRFRLRLLTYCCRFEEAEIVSREYDNIGIDTELVVHPKSQLGKIFWRTINAETVLNPFNRYAGLTRNQYSIRIKNRINQLYKSGYNPDIIILEWTQVNLFAKWIKKLFPYSKLIEIEVDYVYQNYCRRAQLEKGMLNKAIWDYKAKKMKKLELNSLRIADTVVVNNPKDLNMIKNDGITVPIIILAPYYQSMLASSRTFKIGDNMDIIFYGAMDREENWKSAIWFIDKVLPLLIDLNVTFKVIGGNPNAKLRSYESANVHILGYVDDLKKEFATSMCMVAPLVLGAGIKVKILEGLSAGIPILTNQIGIEGIPAVDGQDFFLCETPRDYATSIREIVDGKVDMDLMEKAEKKLIKESYNLNKDEKKLHEFLVEINNAQGNENMSKFLDLDRIK